MKNTLIAFFLLCSIVARSQTTILRSQWQFDGAKTAPGSTLILEEGERGPLLLKNIKGTAEKPILILNIGHVTIKAAKTASYGIKAINSEHLKIIGTNDYGIEVNGGNIGVSMDAFTTNFTIDHIEVHNCGFAGIMAKTDPTCDKATQRGNFVLYNPIITNNYIHNVGGEGIYLGNSFWTFGPKASCGYVLPHIIVNANVSNNRTDSTGCEGIQVGSAPTGTVISFNTVTNAGLSPFAAGQSNGIQIGEGTGGKCFGNVVKNAKGNGIIVLGLGDYEISDNTIINSGENGIFADSRFVNAKDGAGKYYLFVKNTIVNSKVYDIKLNSTAIPMHYILNNNISGKGVKLMSANVKAKIEFNNLPLK
jgi:hypothetical protein